MKFLLDESADSRLAVYLRVRGHDVTVIAQDYANALSDKEVLAIAYAEQRILIANDRDFGELVMQDRLPHAGVLLFRLYKNNLALKQQRLEYVLDEYADFLSSLVIVTESGVRVRQP